MKGTPPTVPRVLRYVLGGITSREKGKGKREIGDGAGVGAQQGTIPATYSSSSLGWQSDPRSAALGAYKGLAVLYFPALTVFR